MDRPTDFPVTDLFALAERRMAWLEQRQATLAHNVANANTPGFHARDSAPFAAALAQAGRLPLAQSSALHLAGGGPAAGTIATRGHERTASGNTVTLEDELSKVADTASSQDLAVSLFRKYGGLFRTALGR